MLCWKNLVRNKTINISYCNVFSTCVFGSCCVNHQLDKVYSLLYLYTHTLWSILIYVFFTLPQNTTHYIYILLVCDKDLISNKEICNYLKAKCSLYFILIHAWYDKLIFWSKIDLESQFLFKSLGSHQFIMLSLHPEQGDQFWYALEVLPFILIFSYH